MAKNKSTRSKEKAPEEDKKLADFGDVCPACLVRQVAKWSGTETLTMEMEVHKAGKYLGNATKRRFVVCACGQSYAIRLGIPYDDTKDRIRHLREAADSLERQAAEAKERAASAAAIAKDLESQAKDAGARLKAAEKELVAT